MTQGAKISIIIPIFNVSQYINQNIHGIINASINNSEIILIDDGSTDGSYDICCKLAQNNPQIKVYTQSNAGSGGARNLGIEKAQGEYICFLDIDDRIESNLIEKCISVINNDNPEVLIFSYDEINPSYNLTTKCINPFRVLKSNKEVRDIYVDNLLGLHFNNGFVWNKIYRRDFLNKHNIRFGDQRIQQDEIFNLNVYRHLNHLTIIPDILYHYYIYNNGNTRSRFIPERFDIYKSVRNSFLDLYNYWGLNDTRMLKYVYTRFFNNIIDTINFNCYHKDAPFSRNIRNKIITEIILSEDVSECISQLEKLDVVPSDCFKKRYYFALKSKSISQYNRIRIIDNAINFIKQKIRTYIK